MTSTYLCYVCGAAAHTVSEPREIHIGRRSVVVDDTFVRCDDCGEEFYLPGQMEASQRRAGDLLREKENRLSPTAITELRSELGLTQAGFEQLIGAGPKAVGRWERGSVIQNGPADVLMRLIRAVPECAEILAEWQGVELRLPSKVAAAGGGNDHAGNHVVYTAGGVVDRKIIDIRPYQHARARRAVKRLGEHELTATYREAR